MKELIEKECDAIKQFLLDKNASYGNSAADPIRIFSRVSPIEQINIRIDDKLSRLARGNEYVGDDTILDLIGYLILKRILSKKGPSGTGSGLMKVEPGAPLRGKITKENCHANSIAFSELAMDYPRP